MVRALRPPRSGRRCCFRVRGVERWFRCPRRHAVPDRRRLVSVVLGRDPAPEQAGGRLAERPLARPRDPRDRGRERDVPDQRGARARTPPSRPVRPRVPGGGVAVPDRRGDRVPRARRPGGPSRDRGGRGAAQRCDRHDAVPVPSPRFGYGACRVDGRVRADRGIRVLGLRRTGAREAERRAPGDVRRGQRDVRGRHRLREPVARRGVRGRAARCRPADRARLALHRRARQRHPPQGDRSAQGPRPVRQGRADDALGRCDERRPRPRRRLREHGPDRSRPGLVADRCARRRDRASDPRQPGARNAVAASRTRGARPEGDRSPRDRHGARPAPARERDPARVRGAPAHRLRVRGRRHRRARPQRRDRPRERRLLPHDRAPPLARRRPALDRDRRVGPGRSALRLAARERPGDARTRRPRDLPRIADLGGPRRPAAAAAARPRRDRRSRRRPDDPVVVQVPPGPRRGQDAPHAPDQRGDRERTQPHREGPARRSGAGRLGRVAVARGRAPDAEGR